MATINGKTLVKDGKPLDRAYSNGQLVYGRNLILLSTGYNASDSERPHIRGSQPDTSGNINIVYSADYIELQYTGNGTQEWFYGLAKAYTNQSSETLQNKQYTLSAEVMGTAPAVAFRVNDTYSPDTVINDTDWSEIRFTFSLIYTGFYIRLNARNNQSSNSGFENGQTIRMRKFKISEVDTPWTPAPEDYI